MHSYWIPFLEKIDHKSHSNFSTNPPLPKKSGTSGGTFPPSSLEFYNSWARGRYDEILDLISDLYSIFTLETIAIIHVHRQDDRMRWLLRVGGRHLCQYGSLTIMECWASNRRFGDFFFATLESPRSLFFEANCQQNAVVLGVQTD